MRYLTGILLVTLFAAPLAVAKPPVEAEDAAAFRSPGKPSYPLQLAVDVDVSRLQAGDHASGHLRVRAGRSVRDVQLIFRPDDGLRVSSDGVAERSVARLDAGESVTLPVRVEALRNDGHHFAVELRAIDAHGRLMSRVLVVNAEKSAVRRNKPARSVDPGERAAARGEALVDAEQEIVRGR